MAWVIGLETRSRYFVSTNDSRFQGRTRRKFQCIRIEKDWPDLASRYPDNVSEVFQLRRDHIADLQLVEIKPAVWVVVIHPFWDWSHLLEQRTELADFKNSGNHVYPATTFDLSRRLASTVERIKAKP
ncbi:MAG: hypothetical protein AAES65_11015 [Candidatus Thiodiazotropha sp. (ex. Lucinoma kazani)]